MGTNATTLRARNTKNANKPITPIAAFEIADIIISPPFFYFLRKIKLNNIDVVLLAASCHSPKQLAINVLFPAGFLYWVKDHKRFKLILKPIHPNAQRLRGRNDNRRIQ